MKSKARFIKSVIDAANKNTTSMPWARGARRDGFVSLRRAVDETSRRLKSA